MASSNTFFAFLAGAVTGAALLLLANTDKGVEVIEGIKEKGSQALNDGRAAVLNGLDRNPAFTAEELAEIDAILGGQVLH